MKLILLLFGILAVTLASPIPSDSDSISSESDSDSASDVSLEDAQDIEEQEEEVMENTLDLFIKRLEDFEEHFEELSEQDRNLVFDLLEERVESMKRLNELNRSDESSDSESIEEFKASEESKSEESESAEKSDEVEDFDLASLGGVPYFTDDLLANDGSEIRQRVEEFWKNQEEWLAKWRGVSQERRQAFEDYIRERMGEISNIINRSGRRGEPERRHGPGDRHRPARWHHHGHRHHHNSEEDAEVKAQIKEAAENVIDYIRERVKEDNSTFPQESDKEKIKEMFSELPKDFQRRLSKKMKKMEKKFNKMSEEKREKILMEMRQKFSSLPDRETREKDFNQVKENLNATMAYVEGRLKEEKSDFPNDADFQKGKEMIQSLPEYISQPVLKRFERMQEKFNSIPDEKKEKARKKIQQKMRRAFKRVAGHHRMPFNLMEFTMEVDE